MHSLQEEEEDKEKEAEKWSETKKKTRTHPMLREIKGPCLRRHCEVPEGLEDEEEEEEEEDGRMHLSEMGSTLFSLLLLLQMKQSLNVQKLFND